MSSSFNGRRQMPSKLVTKQLGLYEETINPLANNTSNLPTTTEAEEACLGDVPDNVNNAKPHDLTSSRYCLIATSSFHEVTFQVPSFYNGNIDQLKLAVDTMMIKTRDMIVTKGKGNNAINTSDGIEFAYA